ncbi:MAG: hypothetical protein A2X49_12875 [Lentisphaerae bacterium GWF2_52_8]|nr:MAG: hypothetical protein A2X49_12875 [Lentisphaerae bacterium GWF2_52_8]
MKRVLILLSFAAMFAPLALFAVEPFNDGFADKRMEAYLENAGRLYEDASFKEVSGMSGKQCIALIYDNELEAEFHPVPVKDDSAYVLSFRGQWENSETFDNNPTFEAAVDDTWRYGLGCIPTMNIVFMDAEDKPLKDEIFMTMPYGKWHEYRNVFFPPEGAVSMKLKIKSGRNLGVFYIDNIKFEPIKNTPDETVLNFSGFKEDCAGSVFGFRVPALLRVVDGKSMICPPYSGVSSAISLNGPGKYRLSFKGQLLKDNKGMTSLGVQFIDSTGKKIGEIASKKLDSEPLEFTLPKEASKIKLLVYKHLLEEIKFTKLK